MILHGNPGSFKMGSPRAYLSHNIFALAFGGDGHQGISSITGENDAWWREFEPLSEHEVHEEIASYLNDCVELKDEPNVLARLLTELEDNRTTLHARHLSCYNEKFPPWNFVPSGYRNFMRKSGTGKWAMEMRVGGIFAKSPFGEWVHVLPGSPEHCICHPENCLKAITGSSEHDPDDIVSAQIAALRLCGPELAAEDFFQQGRIHNYLDLVETDGLARSHMFSIEWTLSNFQALATARHLMNAQECNAAAKVALERLDSLTNLEAARALAKVKPSHGRTHKLVQRDIITFDAETDIVANASGVREYPSGIPGNMQDSLVYRNAAFTHVPSSDVLAELELAGTDKAALRRAVAKYYLPVGRAAEHGGWL